jgi:hypothetical protein
MQGQRCVQIVPLFENAYVIRVNRLHHWLSVLFFRSTRDVFQHGLV